MTIDPDSPEAFEEVIWLKLAPNLFSQQGIYVSSDLPTDVADGLRDHMVRLLASRNTTPSSKKRYFSKNNANVARLDFLRAHFPDANFVVPFRDPFDHAQSMLRQHLHFLDIHAVDAFACRYMRDIGHFEFGALCRPILFSGFQAERAYMSPETIDYWLSYWVHAYRHLVKRKDILWIDMQTFTQKKAIEPLLERLGLALEPRVTEFAHQNIRLITKHQEVETIDPNLAKAAAELHALLCERADKDGKV